MKRIITPALLAALVAAPCPAQTRPATAPANPAAEMIALNFPDNVEVGTLIDYVSRRLGINILYQDPIGKTRVTLKTPAEVPKGALLGLLQSVLRLNDLALVEADGPGLMKVVKVTNLSAVAKPQVDGAGEGPVTRVFRLNRVDNAAAEAAVKPLLSTPGGNVVSVPESRLLIVSDYAAAVRRAAALVEILDEPGRAVSSEFVPVQNGNAEALAKQLQDLLSAEQKAGGGESAAGVQVVPNARTNQVALLGPPAAVSRAAGLLASLDVPVGEAQSPIRFYKLANTTAADVLETIAAIEGSDNRRSADAGSDAPAADATSGTAAAPPLAASHGNASPTPSNLAKPQAAGVGTVNTPNVPSVISLPPTVGYPTPYGDRFGTGAQALNQPLQEPSTPQLSVQTARGRVAADANTNSIIVIGDPSAQQYYRTLIEQLDRRRPQVLIEATLVTIDTSNNFSLGVEISGNGQSANTSFVTFSSFGLSQTNATTGQLTLTPGLGFNGVVLQSDVAQVVLRALAQNTRAKIISSPRVLINDNAEGTLASLAESPFTSVNTSTVIATTSFGGYAEAGTKITLTPHISEDDYLQLAYQVELSSFTGQGVNGSPPPRQTNTVGSEVTIPDGSTIIVGGLNGSRFSDVIDKIPLLGDIPLVGALFSNRTKSRSQSSLFVFIRPVILRDDQFKDLKFLSEGDVQNAGIPADFPSSEPLTLR